MESRIIDGMLVVELQPGDPRVGMRENNQVTWPLQFVDGSKFVRPAPLQVGLGDGVHFVCLRKEDPGTRYKLVSKVSK